MNLKKALRNFTFFICLIISQAAFSQTSLSDVRVDDLTDQQVRQLMQRAASVGYTTDAQISQMAISQGMSQIEAQKLTVRIDKLKKDDSSGNSANSARNNQLGGGDASAGNNADGTRSYNYQDSLSRDTSAEGRRNLENRRRAQLRDAFGNLIPKVFGEDLFNNGGRINFEPNLRLATPRSYVIGPDDQLLIDITGDNEASYKPKVSPDGNISIQYVGLVAVGGLTIEEAISKLKAVMSKTYPGLRSGRTNLSVNLGDIRSIKITIVGEAVRPGSYTLSSLSTVFNALYASGGPNKNGSFRNIQIVRNSKVVAVVDVYDFLLKGVQKNIRLQDQDVINVPVFKTRIEMNGEVKRPALYEIQSTENLQDAINFAGGFTSQAYSAGVKILQSTNRERKIIDVAEAQYVSYKPANGDKVIVDRILDRFENQVQIRGAVFRPGRFELDKGLTLKQLIIKADGLREDAFLNRGYISRLNIDNTAALRSFDVGRIMSGADPDIPLQREDEITISSIFDLRDEYKVQIQGEVRNPGTFKYGENLTVEALIQMAGGFKEGATPNRIEIARRVQNSDALSKSAVTAQIFNISIDKDLKVIGAPFILQPFDIVSIRSSEGYQTQKVVRIEGEVLYPGSYAVKRKDEKISDILKRAGGLTAMAFPAGASLKRPGPTPDTTFNNKKIDPVTGMPYNSNNTGNANSGNVNRNKEENEKLQNLKRLQLAQGVTDTASISRDTAILKSDFVGIDLVKILRDSTSRYNLLMEDGDIITVPRQLQTIRVTGEVLKPINIVYQSGKSMEEYINESGGFTYNANKRGAYVVYANGSIKATKRLLFFYSYPAIKPGAEIFVPKHPPRQPIGIQGIVGISSALASLAVIMITLFKN